MASNKVLMSSAKYEAPKFDGMTSFSLCKIRMKSSLVLQGLWNVAHEKFSSDLEQSQVELKDKTLSTIFMNVNDKVLKEIVTKKTVSDACILRKITDESVLLDEAALQSANGEGYLSYTTFKCI